MGPLGIALGPLGITGPFGLALGPLGIALGPLGITGPFGLALGPLGIAFTAAMAAKSGSGVTISDNVVILLNRA